MSLHDVNGKELNYGGADRDRTGDPLLAKQVLSQLSYSPKRNHVMVGLGRLELPTSPLSGVRSNQLSYEPDLPGRSRAGQCSEPPSEGKWADIVTRP